MKVLHFAFGGGADNPYLPHHHFLNAVAYTGTHDNNTTLGWFHELDAGTRNHLFDYLGGDPETDAGIAGAGAFCFSGATGDGADAGRVGAGRRASHESARRRGWLLALAVSLGTGQTADRRRIMYGRP